jgi:hypothetical protein
LTYYPSTCGRPARVLGRPACNQVRVCSGAPLHGHCDGKEVKIADGDTIK